MAEEARESSSPSPRPSQSDRSSVEQVTEPIDSDTRGPASASPEERNCIFCRIIRGETPSELLYSDDDYVCFKDISPQAAHHYLVVPKVHHPNLKYLGPEHIPMVEKMAEVGREVLRQQNGDLNDYRQGFHWPPFLMVKHLHLHILCPESQLGMLNRYVVFRKDSWFFTSSEGAVSYLKNKI